MEIKERKVVEHDIIINEEEKNAIRTTNEILKDLSIDELEFIDADGQFFDYDDYNRFSAFLECFLSDDRINII